MFTLVSDVQQNIKASIFGRGWIHLATAKIPLSNISQERYFMLLMNTKDSQVYIEEYVDFPDYFVKIKEDKLWQDLYMYFTEKGLIKIGINKEFKIAKKE